MARKQANAAEERKVSDDEILSRLCRFSSPREFKESIVHKPTSVLALGIDPGTLCGFSYGFVNYLGETIRPGKGTSGIWDLSLGKHDSSPMRLVRLRGFLSELSPDLVFVEGNPINSFQGFERATNTGASIQGLLVLDCIRSAVALWCEERHVPCAGVTVSDIKRRATGKGNCSKLDMIVAANLLFEADLREEVTGSDNVADAMFTCQLALETAEKAWGRK